MGERRPGAESEAGVKGAGSKRELVLWRARGVPSRNDPGRGNSTAGAELSADEGRIPAGLAVVCGSGEAGRSERAGAGTAEAVAGGSVLALCGS